MRQTDAISAMKHKAEEKEEKGRMCADGSVTMMAKRKTETGIRDANQE